jgi:uncharacterized protein (TIGR02117 family)
LHIFATARAARSALFVLWLAAQAVAGCTQLPLPPESAAEPRAEAIYVLAGGWHTELALPVSLIGDDVAALKPDFPGARYLVFGWGARDYYVAADPGLAEALGAILPGPAVMLVMALPAAPVPSDDASLVFISQQGAERLSRWLWDELAKEPDGRPRRIAAGPYPQSIFYAASGSYDITHTCNTWTAEALRIAGLPVSTAGVMFADQVTGQLAPFAKPAPALPRLSR